MKSGRKRQVVVHDSGLLRQVRLYSEFPFPIEWNVATYFCVANNFLENTAIQVLGNKYTMYSMYSTMYVSTLLCKILVHLDVKLRLFR